MRRFDLSILIPAVFLTLTGTLEIMSYTSGRMLYNYFAALIIGFFGMFIFALTKYKVFIKFRAVFLYALGIALLIIVLAAGKTVNGSRSWLNAGFIIFQPSEIAKLTTIVFLTYFLSDSYGSRNSARTIFFIFFYCAIPLFLVFRQPDIGTSLVFAVIFFSFIYFSRNIGLLIFLTVAGAAFSGEVIYFCAHPPTGYGLWMYEAGFFGLLYALLRYLMKIRKAHIPVITFALFFALCSLMSMKTVSVLKPYQKNRILNFIKPSRDTLNSGYHLRQSLITIGSGKFSGKGYRKGTQARLGFLPGKYTDFIFSSIAEEFGFAGVFLVLAAYFVLFLRIIKISMLAVDQQGTFLALSVFAILFFQTVLNIGMTLGIMPITGLPLPFVSYGGTALVVYLCMLGIVMNVAATAEGY